MAEDNKQPAAKIATKNTHVAVHVIQTNNEKGERVEYAPGTVFTPAKADVKFLEAAGAITKYEEAEAGE